MNHLIEGSTAPTEPKNPEEGVKFQGAEVGGFVMAVMAPATEKPDASSEVLGSNGMQGNTGFDNHLQSDE